MNDFTFEDYSLNCTTKINDITLGWLRESAQGIAEQAASNSRIDLGQLKGSWTSEVDEGSGSAKIGSPLENAIWEEFGTGEYAIQGGGRSTPWKYQDRNGQWHTTRGKKPNRAFHTAWISLESIIKARLEELLRGMG